ncbi:MAG: 50S ribosomal protein L24 [candidate division Zixibacteria bacterium]|nr:50S ribosomal protein L24 [candidate division Zixibacteria bacterium]
MRIRKGDTVVVIAGDDKGKSGKVLKLFPADNKAIVEGVNFIKRHTRPSKTNPKGGILEKEGPINLSNLMVFCGKCSSTTKVGFKVLGEGGKGKRSKVRICRKCGEVI